MRRAVSLGLGVAGAAAAATSNPFAGRAFYVNPANQAEYDGSIATASGQVQENLKLMRNVASAYWIDVKAKVRGTGTGTLEGILADAASKATPELVTFIWYDLPNRDCAAHASNGEICCSKNADGTCNYDVQSDCADGLQEYRSEYVDPFVSVLQAYQDKVPIVVVVEPDSLPNLATNLNMPHCGNQATQAAYKEGIAYALQELTTKAPAVTVYLDAAHGGWMGWEDNLEKYMALLKEMNVPAANIRGFSTNVANYQPLGKVCPFQPDQGARNAYCLNNQHQSDECCADPCKLTSQYNPANNEHNYAQDLVHAAKNVLGMDAHVIIDTGRNGVEDMRQDCSNWCNIRGAGAGLASTADVPAEVASFVDAYFWLKTPGESDGCTETLPSGDRCPRFDSMCSSQDSLGSQSAEPRAPEAGAWFDFQVKMLAANARLSVTAQAEAIAMV